MEQDTAGDVVGGSPGERAASLGVEVVDGGVVGKGGKERREEQGRREGGQKRSTRPDRQPSSSRLEV